MNVLRIPRAGRNAIDNDEFEGGIIQGGSWVLEYTREGGGGSLEEFITPGKHLQEFPGNEEAIRPSPLKKGKEWTSREYEGNGGRTVGTERSVGTVASSEGVVFGPRTGKE